MLYIAKKKNQENRLFFFRAVLSTSYFQRVAAARENSSRQSLTIYILIFFKFALQVALAPALHAQELMLFGGVLSLLAMCLRWSHHT